jgi:hypothetical protein
VHRDHSVLLGRRQIRERNRSADPGAGHEAIGRTVAEPRFGHEARDLVFLGDIAFAGKNRIALARNRCGTLLIAKMTERHSRTRGGESPDRCGAEAAAAPGHDHTLARQLMRHAGTCSLCSPTSQSA